MQLVACLDTVEWTLQFNYVRHFCYHCTSVDYVDTWNAWLNFATNPPTASRLHSSWVSTCLSWLVGSGSNWTLCRGPIVPPCLCRPWYAEKMRKVACIDAASCATSPSPTYWPCAASARPWERDFRHYIISLMQVSADVVTSHDGVRVKILHSCMYQYEGVYSPTASMMWG